MNPQTALCIALLALCASVPAPAAECSAASGAQRTPLLELYTSEGCSSCPPADRWLSGLAAAGHPPDTVVPLAFHVDYWDYIGWKDRFAQPAFAARQRALAALQRAGVVYTPQVLLNGRDFRGWASAARFRDAVAAIRREPAPAALRLDLATAADGVVIRADAQASRTAAAVLYLALYENGLTSTVRAGENDGATLHHDYVVRAWLGPFQLAPAHRTAWQRGIPLRADWNPAQMGVAAWVQERAGGEVLQALALPLCR